MKNETDVSKDQTQENRKLVQLENKYKRIIILSITASIALAAFLAYLSINSYNCTQDLNMAGRSVYIIIFFIIVLAAYIKKDNKTRQELLNNENSWLYKRKCARFEKKINKWRTKSVQHDKIICKNDLYRKIRSFIFTAVCGLMTILSYIAQGEVKPFVLMLFLIGLFCIASSFNNTGREKLLDQYAEYGLDENMAEEDFKECRLYGNYAAVSRKYLIIFTLTSILPIERITWIYTGLTYSRRSEVYILVINDDEGKKYELRCTEELCRILTDDITEVSEQVTAGYSKELNQLFESGPGNFSEAVKELTLPSPYVITRI